MKVKLYENCSLYRLGTDGEIETVNPETVRVRFVNKIAVYYLIDDPDDDRVIVQARHEKNAAAKLLTLMRMRNGRKEV